jgi:hypothetical protein
MIVFFKLLEHIEMPFSRQCIKNIRADLLISVL